MLSLDLGDGLTLTALEPWQSAELAAFVAAERDHLAPWLPWGASLHDEDRARAFLQRYADGTAADGPRIYALRVAGRMIGGTLFRVFDPAGGLCEVGVWLAADAQGRGHVTRAATAMLDWALLERGLHRAEWHCVPENLASRKIAERLGMRLEGTLRESWQHRDRLWDTEVWAVLAPDWRARSAT
ncbi:GNAT family N-acetyltransferase [Nocardioides halotolerans]|uniref:GNAT family N-acetyltransferase n=1 Tax=Nocardioides halotolerans TaxID=433660 RepID=UPI0004263842|nr:GNAT family protein [Nocardioides halotolerans]